MARRKLPVASRAEDQNKRCKVAWREGSWKVVAHDDDDDDDDDHGGHPSLIPRWVGGGGGGGGTGGGKAFVGSDDDADDADEDQNNMSGAGGGENTAVVETYVNTTCSTSTPPTLIPTRPTSANIHSISTCYLHRHHCHPLPQPFPQRPPSTPSLKAVDLIMVSLKSGESER